MMGLSCCRPLGDRVNEPCQNISPASAAAHSFCSVFQTKFTTPDEEGKGSGGSAATAATATATTATAAEALSSPSLMQSGPENSQIFMIMRRWCFMCWGDRASAHWEGMTAQKRLSSGAHTHVHNAALRVLSVQHVYVAERVSGPYCLSVLTANIDMYVLRNKADSQMLLARTEAAMRRLIEESGSEDSAFQQ